MKIRSIIVDDERPARKKILKYLENDADIEVVGEASSGYDAVEIISREKPDLIFLDVQMPELDGFGVIDLLKESKMPEIVFVTAHDQFALRAFEVHALDYLLKPFDAERFRKVLERARKHLQREDADSLHERLSKLLKEVNSAKPQVYPERLLVNANERAFFLEIKSIDLVEAAKNYVRIYAGGETYLLRGTIGGLYRKLDPTKFARVNRSYIVQLNFIKELQPWFHGEYRIILKNGKYVMWSRNYLDNSSDLFISQF